MKKHSLAVETSITIDDLVRVARAQKLLIVSVVLTVLQFFPSLLLIIAVLHVLSVIVMAKALKIGTFGIVARAIGCFIPLISLIVLLEVNRRATDTLKKAGLHIGLMGVTVHPLNAETIAAAADHRRA